MTGELHEECGVFGIYSSVPSNVAHTVYYGLYALQHRGQESCGIAVCGPDNIQIHKDIGLVNEVFTPDCMENFSKGTIAVGHVRYGTTGDSGRANAQPIFVRHRVGNMATVHNGNLVNAAELRRELELSGSIFHTTSDTEIISYIITRERIRCGSDIEAVLSAMNLLEGAYSLILMLSDKLIALRDKNGFRPLCFGKNENGDYIIASESCALNAVDAEFIRDIKPGEIVVFDKAGVHSVDINCGKAEESICIFEYIYFARPDSVIDGVSVHHSRLKAGEFLAEEYPVNADVVIGVPDSGIDAAIGYSRRSGIPYGIGFIKNKYIGRTFISPGQKTREDKVRIKLNPLSETISGKRVVLVDDSIVRGTTSARIVKLLRDAGAKEVHMRITSPPFTNPCYYGTDVDSRENLIACKYTEEEIRKIIGADSLGYLKLKYLSRFVDETGTHGYCTACFDGKYKTNIPKTSNKNVFEII